MVVEVVELTMVNAPQAMDAENGLVEQKYVPEHLPLSPFFHIATSHIVCPLPSDYSRIIVQRRSRTLAAFLPP